MDKISQNINQLLHQIKLLEKNFGRLPGSVKLLAVSKGHSAAAIQCAYDAGQRHFGESYLQEAIEKIQACRHLKNIIWHFIGPVQSNKTKLIAENFDWVQSVDRIKIAERLNAQRPKALPPLNICIQVNISEESQKSGLYFLDLVNFSKSLQTFSRLSLRGLMTIPKPTFEFNQQREQFQKLMQLFKDLNQQGYNLDMLSMGMSDDYPAAIAEGTTCIRIGTRIFGKRRALDAL